MDAQPGKRMVGRYCLFRPLASGGTATVYLGCLRSEGGFSRAVAIKKLHDHYASDARVVASLLEEARIASRIRHPSVVSVLDVLLDDDEKLLVLEYVHGESLSQLLEAAGADDPIPIPVAVRIIVDSLEGLHAAHEATSDQGVPLMVVHRDVSPQNIMVDAEGRARIVDFGIAKAMERQYTTTNTDEFRGKLAYAAPEQIAGSKVDARTDVWAAGMVLWELMAGRRFFVDAGPAEIVRRISDGVAPPPSSVRSTCSAALDAIVARALDRDPDVRFASARQMALALEKAGPVSDHREVARWMRKLARTRLEERTRLLNEMETELRRSSLAPRTPVSASASSTMAAVAAAKSPDDSLHADVKSVASEPTSKRFPRWPVLVVLALAGGAGISMLARRPPLPVASEVNAPPTTPERAAEPSLAEAPASTVGAPGTNADASPSTAAVQITKPKPTVIKTSKPTRVTAPVRPRPSTAPASDPLGMDRRN